MSEHATTAATRTDVQAADRPRECENCGRDRPDNPERFTVTASDYSAATAAYERVFLCAECWRNFRDDLRRCVA